MAHSIIDHLAYNAWANQRVGEMIQPVDEQLLFQEMKSSFASIGKTLLHIWDAEVVWLKRMQGENPTSFQSVNFKGGKKELLEGFVKSSKNLSAFVQSKSSEFLQSQYSYRTMKGDPFTDIVQDTLYHVVNHGTYHRGQIVTMLREVGVTTLLSTDLVIYFRSKSK